MSMNPQINVSENLCDPEWDEFVAAAPGGHHVQSALWGQVKAVNHWEVIRITAREGGTLVGGAQLLRRTIARTPASVIYLTKGPLVTRGDSEVARQILQQASLVCKKKARCHFCDPAAQQRRLDFSLPAVVGIRAEQTGARPGRFDPARPRPLAG